MTDEEFVKSKHPEAKCSDRPIKMYWPGQGERLKYMVLAAPYMSMAIGEGDTQEEAWQRAAHRVRMEANDA